MRRNGWRHGGAVRLRRSFDDVAPSAPWPGAGRGSSRQIGRPVAVTTGFGRHASHSSAKVVRDAAGSDLRPARDGSGSSKHETGANGGTSATIRPRGLSALLVSLSCFLVLTGCGGSARAQPSSFGRTSTHPRGVDAVMLDREVAISIDERGRVNRREQRRWRILTDYAMDWHSDPAFFFDSGRQRFEVEVARTTRPDGTVTETPESGRNVVLPRPLARAPAFSSLRRAVVDMLGVEPETVAELGFTVADREPTAWSPGGEIVLASPMPVEHLVVALRFAHAGPRAGGEAAPTLRSACVRCELRPQAHEDGEGVGHLWEATNLAAIDTYEVGHHVGDDEEAHGPLPRIVFSTAASWESEVAALARRVDQASAPDDLIRARVAELTRDEASELGRIEAVHDFVRRGVDVVHYRLSRLGYDPATASAVLERSYGSELEVGVLLVAMLRALEVRAHIVLISEDSQIAESVPWLGQFQHVRVVVGGPGAERWLALDSPRGLTTGQLAGERWVLDLAHPGAPRRLPLADPASSQAVATLTLRVGMDRVVTGEAALSLGGALNPYGDLRSSEQDAATVLEPLAQALGEDGAVSEPRVTRFGPDGTTVRGRVTARLPAEAGASHLVSIGVPWPGLDGLRTVDLRPERQTPLALPGPRTLRVRVEVVLPPGWSPLILPDGVERRTAAGWVRQQVHRDGTRLEIERELGLTRRLVEPGEEARSVRELLAEVFRLSQQSLVVDRAATEASERGGSN